MIRRNRLGFRITSAGGNVSASTDSLGSLFSTINGGMPAYVHPSTAYVTAAQGTLTSSSGWAKQSEGGGITFNTAAGVIEFAASATQQIARLTLGATIPNGTTVHVQVGSAGSGAFVVRLGPTNQNVGTGSIHGWKTGTITANSNKTYLEIVQNGGGSAMTFTGICVEPWAIASELLDIYILAGQSNMAGASSGSVPNRAIEIPHPNVLARWGSTQAAHWVTDGGISRARESFIMKANNLAVSPGLHIGRYLAANYLTSGRKILLIGSAQGGTSLLQNGGGWNPTGTNPVLVDDMIADALAAKALNAGNTIAGMFWCQGESDRGASGGANYITKFPGFVSYVRSGLSEASLPICIMGLNPWRSTGLAADTNTTEMIAAQATLAEGAANGITGVCYAGYSTSWPNGTKPIPDDEADQVHFGTEANRLRGVHAAQTFVNFVS